MILPFFQTHIIEGNINNDQDSFRFFVCLLILLMIIVSIFLTSIIIFNYRTFYEF
jgi:hypothetical protein